MAKLSELDRVLVDLKEQRDAYDRMIRTIEQVRAQKPARKPRPKREPKDATPKAEAQ